MHLGEISFCDKTGFNVKSDEHKKKILDTLQKTIQFKVIQKHFVKFEPHLIPTLNKNPHLVGTRTNGNPYLLLLTRHNFVNQCIFVDKKIQQGYFYPRMILATLWFDDALFTDTILDGEMVKTKDGQWVFLISDLLAEKGQSLSDVNLVKRLNRLHRLMAQQFSPDALDVCSLQIKRYFHYEELATAMNTFIPKLPYTIRGLYFKPLFLRFKDILYNFDDSLVVKVQRVRYKHVSNFLTSEQCHSQQQQQLPLPHGGGGCSGAAAAAAAAAAADDSTSNNSSDNNSSDDNNSCSSPCVQIAALSQHATPFAPSSKASAAAAAMQPTQQVYYVRKTSQPDVYHLYHSPSSAAAHQPPMVACISTMQTSKMMRALFSECNVQDGKWMTCQHVPQFGKWVPLHEAHAPSV
jgi:hypothetical protein